MAADDYPKKLTPPAFRQPTLPGFREEPGPESQAPDPRREVSTPPEGSRGMRERLDSMLTASQLSNILSDLAAVRDDLKDAQRKLASLEEKVPTAKEKKFVLAVFALLAAKILGIDFATVQGLFH